MARCHRGKKRKHAHAHSNGMNGKVSMSGTLNMSLPGGGKWSATSGEVRQPKPKIRMW